MSGIFAVWNRDESPADPALLDRMLSLIAYRGPDRQQVWIDGHVGLGHVLLRTTPESMREAQPCSFEGEVWIVADARIDNRDELIRALGPQQRRELRTAADVELILNAYLLWGEAAFQRLVGDFAFLIWDRRTRKIVSVRDPLGIRRLYYHETPKRVVFATEIRALLCTLDQAPPLNEALLRESLFDCYQRYQSETAFEGVYPVRAGQQITWGDSPAKAFYHQWGRGGHVQYRRDEEYVNHFADLFSKAVAARARSHHPVGVLLSGGLDSSSVAVMLKKHEQDGGPSFPDVFLYATTTESLKEIDERKYLDAVARACSPWPLRTLLAEELWSLRDYETDEGLPHDEPDQHVFRRFPIDSCRLARADGCRVMLTGEGGDHAMVQYGYAYGLKTEPLWKLVANWRDHARWAGGKKPVFKQLLSRMASAAPKRLVAGVREMRRRRAGAVRIDWVRGEPPERKPFSPGSIPGVSAMGDYVLHAFAGMWSMAMNDLDRLDGLSQMETRMPYADRRIVDFMVTLPSDKIYRHGWNRWLQREAMRGLLPELVRTRTSKGIFDEVVRLGWCHRERGRIDSLIATSILADWGWVKREPLRRAFRDYCSGKPIGWPLGAWINVELWLRARGYSTSSSP
jgi:asparagine synthase (glutamine-hydrolysing)